TEWIGQGAGIVGRGVTALGTDRAGHVVVATDAAVGKLVPRPAAAAPAASGGAADNPAAELTFQLIAKLGKVTQLAAVTREGAGDGIWAGTESGLYFLNGGAATAVDEVKGAPITSLDLADDGTSVWVGVRGRGLLHFDAGQISAAIGPTAKEPADLVDV